MIVKPHVLGKYVIVHSQRAGRPVHRGWGQHTYYIAPRGNEYTKVYELLRAALAEAGKAGIATFVMRGKQYLTALRAEDKLLVLQTLHWADEVRDPGQRSYPTCPPAVPAKGRSGTWRSN
ncbi:Ku protein [Streptomyces sp. NPDC059349]|uniref:Ku protein n=1 Tax=Streptomyces sp. NPDC059349 TaxID=3346808 RepID=UPI0036D0CDE9